ncbi:MAG: hypothetical protein J5507_06320 [Clostridia bacterium]|nr:hypothetical protein [Clostridia bacterium]
MEFKRCVRCGCFFASNNNVCCNCETKDSFDIAKLNNILEEDYNLGSIEDLSTASGVSLSNLNRYISNNKISGINNIL